LQESSRFGTIYESKFRGFIGLNCLAIWIFVEFSGCATMAPSSQVRFQSIDELTPLDVQQNFALKRLAISPRQTADASPRVLGSNSSCIVVPTTNARVFKLRNPCLEPTEFLGAVRPDHGVTRTWSFENFPSGRIRWDLVEYDQRELREYLYRPAWEFTGDLLSDSQFFYSRPSMTKLGGMFTVAAVFANTSVDENFRDWIQRQGAIEPNVDCWFREFGNGRYVLGATAAAFLVARSARAKFGSGPVTDWLDTWSNRTFRSYLVGGPTLLGLQYITGASRPQESSNGSRWQPFNDNNGASGHTFVGALPFLVAAKMAKRPMVKAALFAGSGLAGYGRLCDDGHYLSQVMLGWMVAYLAVEATTLTDLEPMRYRLVPLDLHGFYGLGVEIRR